MAPNLLCHARPTATQPQPETRDTLGSGARGEENSRIEERPGTDPDNRAQLLATEHWILLASRSTTQSEVLTRINMFLTFASAGLVSLARVGQATDFAGDFAAYSIVILGVVTLVGALTQVRVTSVSMEDLMYVVAMNRLRAAYLELEPSIAPFLMSSPHDDLSGVVRTY